MNTLLDPGYQIPTQRVRRSSIMDSRDKRNCTNYIAVYVEGAGVEVAESFVSSRELCLVAF